MGKELETHTELVRSMELSQMNLKLQEQLVIAVEALSRIQQDTMEFFAGKTASEALRKIKEGE